MFLIRVLLVNFLLVASAIANSAVGKLNHYSDYGVVEQSGITSSDAVSINNDPFGYSDEYTDNESGLQYLQVRYYNPTIMRFTAMDTYPLLNRYAYANENPIMNDDPSGHSAVGASSSTGGNGFVGSLGSAMANFGAYFAVFEVGMTVITSAFPGLNAVEFMASVIATNTVATAAGTAASSLAAGTKITGQSMGESLVDGFMGQVFDSPGEYLIRNAMLAGGLKEVEGGLGAAMARAVADTAGQGLYAAGDIATNAIFKQKTNYSETGLYYAISTVGYFFLNTAAVAVNGDNYNRDIEDLDAKKETLKSARGELSTAKEVLNVANEVLDDVKNDPGACIADKETLSVQAQAASRQYQNAQQAVTEATNGYLAALSKIEPQRRIIYLIKGLAIKPIASAVTYGNR